MATLQVNLPDRIKAAAEAQAAAAGCASVDDYISSLIEADELPPVSSELEAQLLGGLDSGPAVQITPGFIAEIKRNARA
jgi:antitoxin ParD1/3/4